MGEIKENNSGIEKSSFKVNYPDREEGENPEKYYTRFIFKNHLNALKDSGVKPNFKLIENLGKISSEAGKIIARNERLSHVDFLTEVYNRRGFDFETEKIMGDFERLKKEGQPRPPLSLAYIDLDNFKSLNDECGHTAGDLFLINFSHLVNGIIRDKDIFARFGGDEFALILYNTDQKKGETIAKRIQKELKTFLESYRNVSKPLGFSFGLVQWNGEQKLKDFIDQADQKQKEAKAEKKRYG
jgi:diguanylate cyclase (GGDEF)-like protein